MKTLLLLAMINSPFPQQALNECQQSCLDIYKRELTTIVMSDYTRDEIATLEKYVKSKLKECKVECDEEGEVAVQ